MILCPNCNYENGDLALVCGSCGGFLQARVPTLDLFSTVWQIIEAPNRAMKKVALATHKNYLILLTFLYGVALSYFMMWFMRIGERFESLMYLVFTGLLLGLPVGMVHLGLVGIVGVLVAKALGIRLQLFNLLGIAAYATVPLILGLVFIFPVEVLTFGLFVFTQNPPPIVIKPFSYILLVFLDGITIGWSILLLVVGVRTIGSTSRSRSTIIVVLTLVLSLLLVFGLVRLII